MPTYLSAEKLAAMKEELQERTKVTRREIAERIAEAKELGDLSENFEYQTAKEEQGFNETRILELDSMIKDAVLIEEKAGASEISIGTSFDVKTGEMTKTFQIVGSNEASPMDGKISNESPIGQAFLGKAVDEQVEITVPSGVITYAILKIH